MSNTSNLRITFLGFIAVVLTISILTCCQGNYNSELQATMQAEERLTRAHREEVSHLMESYLLRWGSYDTHRDPSELSEFVTGPYRDFLLRVRNEGDLNKELYWLITESATVEDIRIVEYQNEQFKAVACAVITSKKVSLDGELIEHLPPREQCGVYVFVLEDEEWKLMGYFDTSNPDQVLRDWDHVPNWLREIIGELPRDPSMLEKPNTN